MTDPNQTERILRNLANLAEVPFEAVQPLTTVDLYVSAILTRAVTELNRLEHLALLNDREPDLVIGQVRAALEALDPINVHHAIHQQAPKLLGPPTDR
ncbi:hypothetical protein ACQPW3_10680 [Actinosynnema sp. CA-248983]